MMKALILLGLAFSSGMTWAAPAPLTGSSLLLTEKPGVFRSPLGFRIDAADTGWKQIPPPEDNPFLSVVYRSNKSNDGVQAALTVRVDSTDANEDLDTYTKKWMKDYPRLGFEVLTAKKVRVTDEVGFMIDLINRENQIQLRQVLFIKNDKVVNLTCRDHYREFNDTLKSCNEIFRSFRW
jgi:hypothetical protein